MSVEVRESAELLTSVPTTGRMKKERPDAASIASCLQLPTASSQRWGVPGPHSAQVWVLWWGNSSGIYWCGEKKWHTSFSNEISALVYAEKPGSGPQLKNAFQGYRYTETLLNYTGSPQWSLYVLAGLWQVRETPNFSVTTIFFLKKDTGV